MSRSRTLRGAVALWFFGLVIAAYAIEAAVRDARKGGGAHG